MTIVPDRLGKLRTSTTLNGIDFVEVKPSQTSLLVHFLNGTPVAGTISDARITGGDVIPEVRILDLAAGAPDTDGRPTLRLETAAPGDFSTYTLSLQSSSLDPFYSRAEFSFKANCPGTVDCKSEPAACPPDMASTVPIDYLAKDFASFKRALLDFSAQRYPRWVERSEADLGVVLLELLSAVADDLSYTQDRVAAEAYLDTASERRSIVRHARLVDYEPRPATASRVWLQFTAISGPIPAGMPVYARGPDGERIEFETGTGLRDDSSYPADHRWNALQPYIWDKSTACLERGATEMWISGHGHGLAEGVRLLLDTAPEAPGEPPIREMVRLTRPPQEGTDVLLGEQVTHLVWDRTDALRKNHDLTANKTVVRGNLVPSTQGRRKTQLFSTAMDPPVPVGVRRAAVRTGANDSIQFLFTLSEAPLAWLPPLSSPEGDPTPEIQVTEQPETPRSGWRWQRTLLSSDEFAQVFTLDPQKYAQVSVEAPGARQSFDYDGDAGDTLRFGDGIFGMMPVDGAVFEVVYRVGGGSAGNAAADAITGIDLTTPLGALASAVTNPFTASGGADAEPAEAIRRAAPDRFKSILLRAVRKEDYEAAAQSLSWVQRAGTQFRYTGSWHTIFTAADALETGGETTGGVPSSAEAIELIDLLNRRRMAGYESYVLAPRFASLDLTIEVCAKPDAFQGHVKDALSKALSSKRLPDGQNGFFHADNFTFGQPLPRSALEAAIMAVPGVDGVRSITYRRRGRQGAPIDLPDTLPVGPDEILRVDNNLSRPERGSVQITVKGGK